MHRSLVFIFCALVLAAFLTIAGCASQPAVDETTIQTAAAATAYAQPTEVAALPTAEIQTALATLHTAVAATLSSHSTEMPKVTVTVTPIPSATALPTATFIPWPTSIQSFLPLPGQLPNFKPAEIPGLLKSALTVETLEPFNGHGLQRVTGWNSGFTNFEWMDQDHLLLAPIVGIGSSPGGGYALETHPAVISLASQPVWIPLPGKTVDYENFYEPLLPRWSTQLGAMLAAESENSVGLYRPDGELIKVYPGNLLGVSPSATKILIDDLWIDLSNGKTVDFDWQQSDEITAQFYIRPIWSADETRVYACCYLYGDAKTGESVEMPIDQVTVDGRKIESFAIYHFYGTWVLDGAYLLAQPQGVFDGMPGFVPLFDPATKTYRNLSAVAEITDYRSVYPTYALPEGQYVWIDANDGGHLIDLATFKTQAYPGMMGSDVFWSADGQFAWLNNAYDLPRQVLSVASQKLKPVPGNCGLGLAWHPTDNLLFCESGREQTISLLEARTLAVQATFKPIPADCSFSWSSTGDGLLCLSTKEKALWLLDGRKLSVQKKVALPVEFQALIWSPDGKRIALLARDSSLWQVDYPTLENLEQLTSALPTPAATPSGMKPGMNNVVWSLAGAHPVMPARVEPDLHNVTWSPDGTSLAFIGGTDIYIVDTQVKP